MQLATLLFVLPPMGAVGTLRVLAATSSLLDKYKCVSDSRSGSFRKRRFQIPITSQRSPSSIAWQDRRCRRSATTGVVVHVKGPGAATDLVAVSGAGHRAITGSYRSPAIRESIATVFNKVSGQAPIAETMDCTYNIRRSIPYQPGGNPRPSMQLCSFQHYYWQHRQQDLFRRSESSLLSRWCGRYRA